MSGTIERPILHLDRPTDLTDPALIAAGRDLLVGILGGQQILGVSDVGSFYLFSIAAILIAIDVIIILIALEGIVIEEKYSASRDPGLYFRLCRLR